MQIEVLMLLPSLVVSHLAMCSRIADGWDSQRPGNRVICYLIKLNQQLQFVIVFWLILCRILYNKSHCPMPVVAQVTFAITGYGPSHAQA